MVQFDIYRNWNAKACLALVLVNKDCRHDFLMQCILLISSILIITNIEEKDIDFFFFKFQYQNQKEKCFSANDIIFMSVCVEVKGVTFRLFWIIGWFRPYIF